MSLRAEDVTVALAVEDVLPVLLAGVGLVLLVSLERHRRLGELGAALVVAGGGCKVLWKLVAATSGHDVKGLDAALFPLLGLGFALVLAALLDRSMIAWVAALPLLAALLLQAVWPALVLTVVGSTAVLVLAIRRAVGAGDLVAVGLFALTLLAAYGLVPLAAREPQTLSLQWLEQSINTVAQASFALAAWRLWRTSSPRPMPHLIRSTA